MTVHTITPADDPLAACFALADGDTLSIAPGFYPGGLLGVRRERKNITIRGELVDGQRPQFYPAGVKPLSVWKKDMFPGSAGKGLCVNKGTGTIIEGIDFLRAKVDAHNGAGIRHEGTDLTVRNCLFRDCENGILSTAHDNPLTPDVDEGGVIVVEDSEFDHCGLGIGSQQGHTHAIYVSRAAELVVRRCNFHNTAYGHHIKSRARKNWIEGNRLDDESGHASYAIDLSGGLCDVIDNEIHKGLNAENLGAMINFELDRDPDRPHVLNVSGNLLTCLLHFQGNLVRVSDTWRDPITKELIHIPIDGGVIDENDVIYRQYLTDKGAKDLRNYGTKPFNVVLPIQIGPGNWLHPWAPRCGST